MGSREPSKELQALPTTASTNRQSVCVFVRFYVSSGGKMERRRARNFVYIQSLTCICVHIKAIVSKFNFITF
jgi:hypothetical protein